MWKLRLPLARCYLKREQSCKFKREKSDPGFWWLALPASAWDHTVGYWKAQEDRVQGKLLPFPYPEMDSGDVVVADSSDGLLSSLLVGGG